MDKNNLAEIKKLFTTYSNVNFFNDFTLRRENFDETDIGVILMIFNNLMLFIYRFLIKIYFFLTIFEFEI